MKYFALLFLLGALLLPISPAPVVAGPSYPAEKDGRADVEVVELRTECSKTYSTGAGNTRIVTSVGPIHYKENYGDPAETWKNIDTTIVLGTVTRAPYILVIDTANKAFTVTDRATGQVTTIRLDKIAESGGVTNNLTYKKEAPTTQGNKVVWHDIVDGVDLVIEAGGTWVRFCRVIKTSGAPQQATFTVTGKNVVYRAHDKNGEAIEVRTKHDGKSVEETFTAKADQYPICIDPTWQIAASTDDAGGRLTASAYWNNAWTVNPAGAQSATYQYYSGMRFTDITLPPGSEVFTASLNLTCGIEGLAGANCNTRISADDTDDAATFSTAVDYTTRWDARTTARVDWDSVATWVVDTVYTSPDFSSVVQEIVDRPGWASGNDIAIFWDDRENRSPHVDGNRRYAYTYDSDSTKAPVLVITYGDPPPLVDADDPTNLTNTTVTFHGNVTNHRADNITARGFDWDVDSGAPYANNWTESGVYDNGTFSHDVSGLSVGTIVYYRAKAQNSNDVWGYSSEGSFITNYSDSWWHSGWDFRKSVTLDNTASAEHLLNFPFLVHLDDTSINWTRVQDAGQDLRFVKDGNELDFEIERWTDEADAWIWVEADNVTAASHDHVYMYYGNATAPDGQDVTGTWNADYKAVWHFSETAGTLYDSTSNDNDGVVTGATFNAAGEIAGCMSFDGSNYVTIGDKASLEFTTDGFTFEILVNQEAAADSPIVVKHNAAETQNEYWFGIAADSEFGTIIGNDGTGWGSAIARNSGIDGVALSTATWYGLCTSWDGADIRFFANGGPANPIPSVAYAGAIHNGSADMMLATRDGLGAYFQGDLDEVRMSTGRRSDDWVEATYLSWDVDFTMFGADEGVPPGEPVVVTEDATGAGSVTATAWGNVTIINADSISARGFEWGADSGAPYAHSWTESGTFGLGAFSRLLAGLDSGTTHFYRAKAQNSNDLWGYGGEKSFTTRPGAPIDFVLSSEDDQLIDINWTKAVGADYTLVVGYSGRYPTDKEDGWVAYNGTSNTVAEARGLNFDLENPFYRAWSYNLTIGEFSTDYAQDEIGGDEMLLVGFLGLAAFFTWFSYRRREILITFVASLLWFSLAMWMFFSDVAPFTLGDTHVNLLVWVFILMTFVPWLMQMNTEITNEERGQKWSSWGAPPSKKYMSGYDTYKKQLHRRTRR